MKVYVPILHHLLYPSLAQVIKSFPQSIPLSSQRLFFAKFTQREQLGQESHRTADTYMYHLGNSTEYASRVDITEMYSTYLYFVDDAQHSVIKTTKYDFYVNQSSYFQFYQQSLYPLMESSIHPDNDHLPFIHVHDPLLRQLQVYKQEIKYLTRGKKIITPEEFTCFPSLPNSIHGIWTNYSNN